MALSMSANIAIIQNVNMQRSRQFKCCLISSLIILNLTHYCKQASSGIQFNTQNECIRLENTLDKLIGEKVRSEDTQQIRETIHHNIKEDIRLSSIYYYQLGKT